MKRYLKMADVFDLPVSADLYRVDFAVISDDKDSIVGGFGVDGMSGAAAHAINSHDELVKMNQELLAALEQSVGLMVHFGDAYGCVPSNYIEYKAATKAIAKAKGGAV